MRHDDSRYGSELNSPRTPHWIVIVLPARLVQGRLSARPCGSRKQCPAVIAMPLPTCVTVHFAGIVRPTASSTPRYFIGTLFPSDETVTRSFVPKTTEPSWSSVIGSPHAPRHDT